MRFLIIALATALSLLSPAFGQENKEGKTGPKDGMVWFYMNHTVEAEAKWDAAISERKEAFVGLERVNKEGDRNKIRFYVSRVQRADSKIQSLLSGSTIHINLLEADAGTALNSTNENSRSGKITEAEYDEMMVLARRFRTKLNSAQISSEQRSIWDIAVKALNVVDPESYKLK